MKHKRRYLIIIIAAAIIAAWALTTYFVTPGLLLRPSFNKEAHEKLTLVELQEMFAEKQPLNVPLVEDLKLYSPDGNLYGWRLHRRSNTYTGSNSLLLYFGGYDEDSSTAALRFFNQLADDENYPGLDIAVIDWPGFGLSGGSATDDAIRRAAAFIYDYFDRSDNVDEIIVMGYSFGTGPAVYLASERDVSKLILVAPYESAYDLYNTVTPVFYGPLRLLISFKMDAGVYAEDTDIVPLIIASGDDDRVPLKYSEALSSHFSSGCEMHVLKDITHSELIFDSSVLSLIAQYISR